MKNETRSKNEPSLTRKQELCLSCMKCCKSLVFQISTVDTSLEFYKARGILIKFTGTFENRKAFVEIPHVCKNLTPQGCGIYNKRPEACRVYDGRKDLFNKNKCKW